MEQLLSKVTRFQNVYNKLPKGAAVPFDIRQDLLELKVELEAKCKATPNNKRNYIFYNCTLTYLELNDALAFITLKHSELFATSMFQKNKTIAQISGNKKKT
jgi:hypothetical protein